MEKKNIGMKVAIVILCLLVFGLTGYIVYDKMLNQDNIQNDENTTNDNNQTNNCENKTELSINEDKLYKIAKSSYNFIKRVYTNDTSFNLTADGRINISFNNYISNVTNAKDILLYSSHVVSTLYILTEDGDLYKYDVNNNSNNYIATKVDDYSSIVKMVQYETHKANAGGCRNFVVIDSNGNYYRLDSSCV